MLLALLVFGFGLAQVLVQRDVVSSEVRFRVGISAIILSAIPLAVQLTTTVPELWRLPLKYWVKLPVHRLAMNVFGEHALEANIHVMYRHRRFVQARQRGQPLHPPQSRTTPPISQSSLQPEGTINIHDRIIQQIGCLILAVDKFFSFLSNIFLSFAFVFTEAYFFPYNVVCFLAQTTAFNDAFSGLYHTKHVSLVVWFQDEHKIDDFYDSRGRKVTSRWNYPYVLRTAIPMILRDIDERRMHLLKRLNDPPKSMLFEKEKLNGFLKCEEKLTWQELRDINWEEIFKREKSFRWYVLSGVELTQDLFELENLKLQIERLKREQPGEQLGQIWKPGEGEEPNFPLRPNFLKHLEKDEIRGEQQKLEWKREFVRELGGCLDSMASSQDEFNEMQRHLEQEKALLQEMEQNLQRRFSVELPHHVAEERNGPFNVEAATEQDERGVSSDVPANVEVVILNMPASHDHEIRNFSVKEECGESSRVEAVFPDLVTGDLPKKYRTSDERRGVIESEGVKRNMFPDFRERMWWKSARELDSLKQLSQLRPQEAKCLMATELGEVFVVAKVIRNIRLEVAYFPDGMNRRMKCAVRSSSSPSTISMNRYFVSLFDGFCNTAEAAEFLKLVEVLDDNAFVATPMMHRGRYLDFGQLCRQWVSRLWIVKATGAYLEPDFRRRIFVCESMENMIDAVLRQGKKLDSDHINGATYV